MAAIKSIEEKAKAYDEALERAKELLEVGLKDTRDKRVVLSFFPELAESEDERIRKEIISMFETLDRKDWIAWLEKQGEKDLVTCPICGWEIKKQGKQKTVDEIAKEVCKNKESAVTFLKSTGIMNEKGELAEQYRQEGQNPAEEYNITGIGSKNAQGKLGEMIKNLKPVNKVLEHDSAWSEKYIADVFEKVGLAKIAREQSNDSLTNALQDAMIELSKFLPQQNLAWSKEDKKIWEEISDMLWEGYRQSCSKFTWDNIRDWIKPKIEYFKDRTQPKQEWSEEDEYCRHQLIVFCENCMVKDEGAKKCAHWLKSLKPQNTWKPNGDQIDALYDMIRSFKKESSYSNRDDIANIVEALLEQLKAL